MNTTRKISVALITALTMTSAGAETDDHEHLLSLAEQFKLASLSATEASPRKAQSGPADTIKPLIKRFRQFDPYARFTFFHGHVDSFSTRPKSTIPDYAKSILAQFDLEPAAVKPEIFATTTKTKEAHNHEDTPDQPLPFVNETIVSEPLSDTKLSFLRQGKSDEPDNVNVTDNSEHDKRPDNTAKLPNYRRDGSEAKIAHAVVNAFLGRYQTLFELPADLVNSGLPNLEPIEFGEGRFFTRLTYQQRIDGLPLHSGKTVVLLDHNWNVINISRILMTPTKMKGILQDPEKDRLDARAAQALTLDLAKAHLNADLASARTTEATLGFDAVRGIFTWKVRLVGASAPYQDLTLTLAAADGELLNVADNVDRYTDAQVKRWGFSSGDYTLPVRFTTSSFYTRDDNTLVHDFFHIVTDNRNDGDPLHTCGDTPVDTLTESAAYGTTNGSNYIRPTRRSDRNFALWNPAASSGTFGESNTYYWARWFMQWVKPALNDLGVLPSGASNYYQATIIANSCNSGVGVHNSSFPVTIYNNVGEGLNTIRLPERCRSSNGNCSSGDYADSNSSHIYTFEGNGGYSAPGVIHHELNHFVMKRYFGIGSGLDCGASEQLKFLHEGAAGRSLPQAYWHNYYGTGYAPSNTNRQYRANQISGRPHTDNTDLNALSDYLCSNTSSPYNGGSVVHQAMWKLYHGISVNGSTQSSIPRVATDTDFLVLYYWAMDLVSGSTFQDRYEMANRVMEIMENHSALSSTGKQQWCDVWDTHELDNFIVSAYCS